MSDESSDVDQQPYRLVGLTNQASPPVTGSVATRLFVLAIEFEFEFDPSELLGRSRGTSGHFFT